MSIALITAVRLRLDVNHGELLVAIELADAANDTGAGIFVGVNRIADHSRQDPRTVQRQLKRLREIGWLELVKPGGGTRADGSGIPAQYRINPEWVKGDSLPGLPDFEPRFNARDKGDTVPGLQGGIPRQNSPPTVTKGPTYPDTAVSPDPLTHIPSEAPTREQRPSGSRAAPKEPIPYDEPTRRGHWNSIAARAVIDEAVLYGIVRIGTPWHEIPDRVRTPIAEKVNQWVGWAIEREMERVLPFREINDRVIHELRIEMRPFKPPTVAEQSSANAEAA
jgi:hypothetical protein